MASRIDVAGRILREAASTLGKAAVAITVFGVVFFGFQNAVTKRADAILAAQPLPDQITQSECAVWFVGSSSMSRWASLQRDMSPWSTHNRAIGGATLKEINQRFQNEANPQRPQAIVFYAGENDLAFGAPVGAVTDRFRDFLRLKTERLGSAPVLFVSLKPSPMRWNEREEQRQVNDAVRAMAAERSDLFFVDTVPSILVDGRPGPFFDTDGLHLNEEGYAILTAKLQAALRSDLPRSVVHHCAPATPRA